MANTLTTANSVITLTIDGLFFAPQQLQGFAADDVFETDSVQSAEVLMGVDGYLSGGWVPTMKKQSYYLQADSLSNGIFDAWVAAQETVRESYVANGIIIVPSLGLVFTLIRGFLTGYPPIAPAKKILQPRKYEITWNSIIPAPI